MKKITIALILTICLLSAFFLPACKETEEYTYKPLDATVRYLTNVSGETVTLSSGREVTAENVLFESQDVKTGDIVTPPATQPTRAGYVFKGWAIDKEGTALFDFTKPVTGSVNLYAKWEHDEENATNVEYSEPRLSFTEKIDDSKAFDLTGVCNQKISAGSVNLTTAAINRLTAKATNVKELLNYTRASSTVVKSATYAEGVVSVTYAAGGVDNVINVTVNDVTATETYVMTNSTYENKAKKYESTDFANNASYNVIMGGSSSMENWSSSVADMQPVTTKNVGIGGTSSFQWLTLSDRLIMPFNPRAVVLYVGINDLINYGKSAKTTTNNLIALFDHIHECLPNTMIHYILINYVPGYKGYFADIHSVNESVTSYAEQHSAYMNIIDAGVVLNKTALAEGQYANYSEAYFLSDKLHMSLAGYELWGAVVKQAVIAKDKDLYGND